MHVEIRAGRVAGGLPPQHLQHAAVEKSPPAPSPSANWDVFVQGEAAQGEDPPLQDRLVPGLGEHGQVESSLLELWLLQHPARAPRPAASGLAQSSLPRPRPSASLMLSVERGSHVRALLRGLRFPLPPGSPVPCLRPRPQSLLAGDTRVPGQMPPSLPSLWQGLRTLGIVFLDLAVPCLPAASEGAGSGREQI